MRVTRVGGTHIFVNVGKGGKGNTPARGLLSNQRLTASQSTVSGGCAGSRRWDPCSPAGATCARIAVGAVGGRRSGFRFLRGESNGTYLICELSLKPGSWAIYLQRGRICTPCSRAELQRDKSIPTDCHLTCCVFLNAGPEWSNGRAEGNQTAVLAWVSDLFPSRLTQVTFD
jgi:hypothetical protein